MSDNNIKFVPYKFDPLNWKYLTVEQISTFGEQGMTDFSGFGAPKENPQALTDPRSLLNPTREPSKATQPPRK